jgi:hypothetical protein
MEGFRVPRAHWILSPCVRKCVWNEKTDQMQWVCNGFANPM